MPRWIRPAPTRSTCAPPRPKRRWLWHRWRESPFDWGRVNSSVRGTGGFSPGAGRLEDEFLPVLSPVVGRLLQRRSRGQHGFGLEPAVVATDGGAQFGLCVEGAEPERRRGNRE